MFLGQIYWMVILSQPRNLILLIRFEWVTASHEHLFQVSILCAGRVGCVGIASDLDLSDADFYDAAEDDFCTFGVTFLGRKVLGLTQKDRVSASGELKKFP